MKNACLPLIILFSVTGCSIGQSEFNCSGGDNNALCGSSRTIYEATNGPLETNDEITIIHNGEAKKITLEEYLRIGSKSQILSNMDSKPQNKIQKQHSPANYNGRGAGPWVDKKQETQKVVIEQSETKPIESTYTQNIVPPQFAFDGSVMREPTKVMRVWIAPWTDKSDDLHLSSLIYTDIEKRKWAILSVNGLNGYSTVKPHLGNPTTNDKNNTNKTINLNGMEVREKEAIENRFKAMAKNNEDNF